MTGSNDLRHNHFVAEQINDDDECDVLTGEVTNTRRYPQRVRHAPSQYSDYVPLT